MLFLAIVLLAGCVDAENVMLNIPPRSQWNNSDGYCGETSIQAAGLFYGCWVSEDLVRKVAGGELLVAVNDGKALTALHFNYDEWRYRVESNPQWQNYLGWTKNHLAQRHPVIITVYMKEYNDPDYDHIIPAIGFNSTYTDDNYHDKDIIWYNDNFNNRTNQREFDQFEDDRKMKGNCANQDLCVPTDVDYGVAVTGIVDTNGETFPVYMAVNSWDEPNVSIGRDPSQMYGNVTVSGLTSGKNYSLLRYDDYQNVPNNNFLNSKFDKQLNFTAQASTRFYADPDSFTSSGARYYRCVAAK